MTPQIRTAIELLAYDGHHANEIAKLLRGRVPVREVQAVRRRIVDHTNLNATDRLRYLVRRGVIP